VISPGGRRALSAWFPRINMFGSDAESFGNPAYCTGALPGLG
jgi:hypothetical protein